MDELDEEADESHDAEADGCGNRDLGELLPIWLRTSLYQPRNIEFENKGAAFRDKRNFILLIKEKK